jgi:hypothetical protein
VISKLAGDYQTQRHKGAKTQRRAATNQLLAARHTFYDRVQAAGDRRISPFVFLTFT